MHLSCLFFVMCRNRIWTEGFPSAIKDAVRLIALEEGKVYTIQTSSRLEKIPYKEILYIEREGKNARIITLHGWGLKSAQMAAEKYDGMVQMSYEEHIFRAVVTMSCREVQRDGEQEYK